MRKLLTLAAVAGMACAALAGPYQPEVVSFTHTGDTPVTQTITRVAGKVLQVHVILGTATNVDVDITVVPAESTEGEFTLYSADDVVADTVLYPAFDRHNSAGSALTNDPPEPYIYLDPIKYIISDWLPTNGTAKIKLVWLKE